jgi:hypothetical protein
MKQLLQFIFSFKSQNIERLDKSLQHLMKSEEFNTEIVAHKLFKKEQRIMYRVKMPVSSLIAFKRKVDTEPEVELFELFEFREW